MSASLLFAAFGLLGQALLVAFFSARRWRPRQAMPLGYLAYAFAALGLPLGIGLTAAGDFPDFVIGPILMAGWALLGGSVDIWRPRPWRGPPIAWGVLVPYVALYFFGQMWLWWPLWDTLRWAWAVFGVLFVASTVLNIRGHAAAVRPG